jgi:predicted RNA-binding Zn-ribbon protein involved in translation (DUF1610 family)
MSKIIRDHVAAEQSVQRTVCTGCQNEVTENDVYCPNCGLWNSTNRR